MRSKKPMQKMIDEDNRENDIVRERNIFKLR